MVLLTSKVFSKNKAVFGPLGVVLCLSPKPSRPFRNPAFWGLRGRHGHILEADGFFARARFVTWNLSYCMEVF